MFPRQSGFGATQSTRSGENVSMTRDIAGCLRFLILIEWPRFAQQFVSIGQ
jgi:hypothetical protein